VISEQLSGLGISYRQRDPRTQLLELLPGPHARQAGDRVPNLELKPAVLTDETRTSVDLYDLLRQATYALFVDVAPAYADRDQQQIARLLDRVKHVAGEAITPYIVFEQGSETVARRIDATAFIDFKQQFRHKLGTRHGDILLVRPDSYLAVHVPGLQQERFLSDLQRWVTPAGQRVDTFDGVRHPSPA
jgi:hypothetical protein